PTRRCRSRRRSRRRSCPRPRTSSRRPANSWRSREGTMATDVVMPQMGESLAEGTVTKWLKQVGDKIGRDEPRVEIPTDKVDWVIPAPAGGYLTAIKVPEGTTVDINTVVAVIDA